MRSSTWISLCLGAAALWAAHAPVAEACGGFFCSQTPVDQNAERVIFAVQDDGTTDMIVQISFQGSAPDFAWVLPLADVPNEDDLDVFPQLALTSLDAQTGPTFQWPENCFGGGFPAAGEGDSAGGDGTDGGGGGVEVYIRKEVGNYDVAVIGSDDPEATAAWLRENDFRISDAMDEYIALYTKEGMKFLALKLQRGKDVQDITPFKLTLKGETPNIPLRITSIAAEPEMGIVVWVFADQRFEPGAGASEVKIDDTELRWDPNTWQPLTNYSALVAKEVDKVGGLGWVVEQAGKTDELRAAIENTFVSDDMQTAARDRLLGVLEGKSYVTRLYTRLSAEEMIYDPVFKRSDEGDVSRVHQLPYVEELCTWDGSTPVVEGTPCDFTACGALGLCREGEDENGVEVAACACAPGATARTTFDATPDGSLRVTVACQDKRMSFLNPGDRNVDGVALPDPCAGFDCGDGGTCVAMNMTPTCECDKGFAARGWIDGKSAQRRTSCLVPKKAVPDDFYNRRPASRNGLPIGRPVDDLPAPSGVSDAEDPFPQGNMDAMAAAKGKGGGCSVSVRGDSLSAFGWLLTTAGLAFMRRRPRERAARARSERDSSGPRTGRPRGT